jgi:hypothetical protein
MKFEIKLSLQSYTTKQQQDKRKTINLFFLSYEYLLNVYIILFFFHSKDMSSIYDIIIIGGGIVGLGIFRQLILNGYKNVLLLDKSSQILTGASSGNSGILHTGFDTIPQTLESKLVKRGYELYQSFAQDIELPIKRIGAYIIAWEANDLEILKQIIDIAHKVDYLFIYLFYYTIFILF